MVNKKKRFGNRYSPVLVAVLVSMLMAVFVFVDMGMFVFMSV